jgi:hypothetical protein
VPHCAVECGTREEQSDAQGRDPKEGVRAALRRAAATLASVPDPKPRPHYDLARLLIGELTPEGAARIAEATAEIHDLIAALNTLAARVERLRSSGQRRERASLDLPQDIRKWQPGDSLNMPGELGGEFFETDPEVFFWNELDLQGVREGLAEAAATLASDLADADTPYRAWTRAEELLAHLPPPILDALRARVLGLTAPARKRAKGKAGAPRRRR